MLSNFFLSLPSDILTKSSRVLMVVLTATILGSTMSAMPALSVTTASADAGTYLPHSDKWTGSAQCTVKCADGRCVVIKATCSASASYQAAETKLTASLKAQAKAMNGKIDSNSYSFDIKIEFAIKPSSRNLRADLGDPKLGAVMASFDRVRKLDLSPRMVGRRQFSTLEMSFSSQHQGDLVQVTQGCHKSTGRGKYDARKKQYRITMRDGGNGSTFQMRFSLTKLSNGSYRLQRRDCGDAPTILKRHSNGVLAGGAYSLHFASPRSTPKPETPTVCGCLVRDGSANGKARYRGVRYGRVSVVLPGGSSYPVNVVPGAFYTIPNGAGWNRHVPPR